MKRVRRFVRGLVIEGLGVLALALIVGVAWQPAETSSDNETISRISTMIESFEMPQWRGDVGSK